MQCALNIRSALSALFAILFAIAIAYSPLQAAPVQAAGKCYSYAWSAADQQNSANWVDTLSNGQCPLGYVPVTGSGARPDSFNTGNGSMTDQIGTFLSNIVYWIGPGIASYAAYIAAYFFNFVIQLSLNSTAYALDFLSDGWTIVRDLANMSFIFILIYIAMKVMLKAEESGTIKMLASVVVVALLVNFSFFFTRVVIDAGNILALQFYNAIPGGTVTTAGNATQLATVAGVKDLSASLMDALKVQTLFNQSTFDQAKNSCGPSGNGFWCGLIVTTVIYLAVAAMLWMLFFAFLQVGIKFMLRIIGLWLLLIASPLAFVARAINTKTDYFGQWLQYLLKFSFYPAIFLFMFLIITKFTTALVGGSGSLLTGIFNSAAGTNPQQAFASVGAAVASVGIRLGFIVALMYIALQVSETIVKEGSRAAHKVTGWTGGKAFGTVGAAGRYTLGWGGYRMAQNKTFQNYASKSLVGRALMSGATRASKATFDARNSSVISRGAGILGGQLSKDGKVTKLDFGKVTQKDGYKGDFDKRVKALQEEAKRYGSATKEQKEAAVKEGERLAKEATDSNTVLTAKQTSLDARKQSLKESRDNLAKIKADAAEARTGINMNLTLADAKARKAENEIKRLESENKKGTAEMANATTEWRKADEELLALKTQLAAHDKDADKKFAAASEALDAQVATLTEEEKTLKTETDTFYKEQLAKLTPEVIDAKKQFASLVESHKGNWKTLGYRLASSKEAANKIRKGKSKQDELLEKIKEVQEDGAEPKAEKSEEKKDGGH